jgi:hypothetical protein
MCQPCPVHTGSRKTIVVPEEAPLSPHLEVLMLAVPARVAR